MVYPVRASYLNGQQAVVHDALIVHWVTLYLVGEDNVSINLYRTTPNTAIVKDS